MSSSSSSIPHLTMSDPVSNTTLPSFSPFLPSTDMYILIAVILAGATLAIGTILCMARYLQWMAERQTREIQEHHQTSTTFKQTVQPIASASQSSSSHQHQEHVYVYMTDSDPDDTTPRSQPNLLIPLQTLHD